MALGLPYKDINDCHRKKPIEAWILTWGRLRDIKARLPSSGSQYLTSQSLLNHLILKTKMLSLKAIAVLALPLLAVANPIVGFCSGPVYAIIADDDIL
jgi:hypothetical protein